MTAYVFRIQEHQSVYMPRYTCLLQCFFVCPFFGLRSLKVTPAKLIPIDITLLNTYSTAGVRLYHCQIFFLFVRLFDGIEIEYFD